jgi:hypothetical protein
MFAGTTVEPNLKHFHPFGCPVYVLQAPLQSGNMFPKWKERSRVGIYLGRSPHHAATVPLVLNTQTGLVSPQFHVVYDDNFDTVLRDKHFQSLWQYKAQLQETKDDFEFDSLATDSTEAPQTGLRDYPTMQIPTNLHVPWDSPPDSVPDPEGEQQPANESTMETAPSRTRPSRQMRPSEGDVSRQRTSQRARQSPDPSGPVQAATGSPAQSGPVNTGTEPSQRRAQRSVNIAPTGKTRSGRTVKQRHLSYASAYLGTHSPSDTLQGEIEDIHPLAGLQAYAATKQRDPDTMTLERAMREPDAEEFIKAMEKELQDHTERGHWEIVPASLVPKTAKPINMVWSMKRKRDPAGDIIKWKARLCAHGGMQVYGDTYWDTYSPVVSWTTVRLVMILALVLGWEMRSIDFILAYPQADVSSKNIYMRLPKGTRLGKNHSGKAYLRLIKNLYGLRDAGLTWFSHISKGLLDRGWRPSDVDPCLFTKGNVILVLYVDDAYLTGPDKTAIDKAIKSLQKDFALTDEGDLKDYLGVRIIRHNDGSAELVQPRMIDRCLQIVGIPTRDQDDSKIKSHDTPAEPRPILNKDTNGPPRQEQWNYRAAVGALNYLQAMSRPEISYQVHQCARFCNDPKLSHEKAVK